MRTIIVCGGRGPSCTPPWSLGLQRKKWSWSERKCWLGGGAVVDCCYLTVVHKDDEGVHICRTSIRTVCSILQRHQIFLTLSVWIILFTREEAGMVVMLSLAVISDFYSEITNTAEEQNELQVVMNPSPDLLQCYRYKRHPSPVRLFTFYHEVGMKFSSLSYNYIQWFSESVQARLISPTGVKIFLQTRTKESLT